MAQLSDDALYGELERRLAELGLSENRARKLAGASCHALAAAHAKGAAGPNLDQLKPSTAIGAKQVTNRGGGMPAFGGRLSTTQIDAIASYVASSARKG